MGPAALIAWYLALALGWYLLVRSRDERRELLRRFARNLPFRAAAGALLVMAS